MKILNLVHQYYPDHVGGTEFYTRSTAQELARQGHHVAVFHRHFAKGQALLHREDADEVQVWSAQAGAFSPAGRFAATFSQPRLMTSFEQVLDVWQPQLVHVQHLMGLPVSIIDRLQQQGIPYLITLWDFWWVCANAQLLTNYNQTICSGPNAFFNCARCLLARSNRTAWWPAVPPLAGVAAWRNWHLWSVIRSAGSLIAPTPFVRDWYVKYGFPAATIQVLPPGLNLDPVISRKPREANMPLKFGYIGGLSPQKGVHVLIEAFNALNQPAELWIAGDEQPFPDYMAQLRAAAGPSVRFLGKLDRAGIWQTLAALDVVVVPSIWYETFSIIIAEAFAAGAPVVASKIGPLADRVRHGVDGLLFEPGNANALAAALRRFLIEPNLLTTLQANIQPPLSLQEHVDRLQSIYEQLLAER